MASTDMFADIAFAEHPIGSSELVEFSPPPFEKRYFKSSCLIAQPVAKLTYHESLQKFHEELQLMREKYAPFLKNHVPEPPLKRRVLEIKEFKFRYKAPEDGDFTRVLNGEGKWEDVTIPDYRGPAGLKGKWTGFYRTEFEFHGSPGKRVYIVFKGVDYIANVYVNNKCVGSHEGFFSPFEFDITEVLKEHNVLVVEVKNDYPMLGVQENQALDGDKIYAATGPGWDDPEEGWHHCPPGAGIYNKVYIEERAELYIKDIFVRPDIDNDSIEAWIDIFSSRDDLIQNLLLDISVYDRNIKGEKKLSARFDIPYVGPGMNYYRYKIPFSDYLLWEPKHPWLYTLRASITYNGQLLDVKDRNFGMRKFHMDEVNEPKGMLYLNNRPIILRGANEMGHLQQCVMRGDFEQLVDDILIAKLANLNFFRVTQRPVQEEIYDYFDMLGMMHQCDFPVFGTLRRNQFYEALRQVGEMERLIRSHPSSIMVTFINEPVAIRRHEDPNHKYNKRFMQKAHRHLFRKELEDFFEAARKAIALENPDRVVKNVEGDYDPPTRTGLSDFHCYCMWYTNHAVPFGKLYKGYLPPLKKGWRTGCGEYGVEGLDNYEVMLRYPKEWLPQNEDDVWFPNKIRKAQTYSMHGDWFEEQEHIRDWIEESQRHQAFAIRLMTDAFRRRADVIVSTAVHLLIDAWPAGWMKALVGVDRVPKPAYFALRESLEPVRLNLRCDRWKVYCGDNVEVEVWILNDTPSMYEGCKVIATLRDENRIYESFEMDCDFKAVSSTYIGSVAVKIPQVEDKSRLYLDACLIDGSGHKRSEERFVIEAYSRLKPRQGKRVAYLGADAYDLLYKLEVEAVDFKEIAHENIDAILISSVDEFKQVEEKVISQIDKGVKAVFMRGKDGPINVEIQGRKFVSRSINPVYFVAISRHSDLRIYFESQDLSYCYNAEQDMIDFIADSYIDGGEIDPLVYTYKKAAGSGRKERLPVVGSTRFGKREIIFCNLLVENRISYNPTLDRLMLFLLGLL